MLYLDSNNSIELNSKNFWLQEAKFWSEYGKIYKHLEAATPYKKMLLDIGLLIADIQKDRWLDAGCGPGTMIDLLLKNQNNYKEIFGIDFDGVMLDQATTRLSEFKNIYIKSVDISNGLSFEDNFFDGIVANLVLSYIIVYKKMYVGEDALKNVIKEFYRVLRPGGLFIWTTPVDNVNFFNVFLASWRQVFNPLTPQYIYYGPRVLSYANKIQSKGKRGIYHFYDSSKLDNIMKEIGFRNINIKKTFANQAYLVSANK